VAMLLSSFSVAVVAVASSNEGSDCSVENSELISLGVVVGCVGVAWTVCGLFSAVRDNLKASRVLRMSFMDRRRFLGYFWYRFFCFDDHKTLLLLLLVALEPEEAATATTGFMVVLHSPFSVVPPIKCTASATEMTTGGLCMPISSWGWRRVVCMDASGKISRTHPTAVLISCVPPSQRRLYVTVNFGRGLTSPCRGRCCCVDSVVFILIVEVIAAVDFASIFRFRSMVVVFVVVVVSPSSLGMILLLLLLLLMLLLMLSLSLSAKDISMVIVSFRFVMSICL